MTRERFVSCFERVYDAAVVGGGCAGVAAAMALRQAGRSVLLIDLRGDLLWELSRAFAPEVGACDSPHWRRLCDEVARRIGRGIGRGDGAVAEVVATRVLADDDGLDVLYYAAPVAVETGDRGVEAVILGTKSGRGRVAAGAWVDATERGTLVRLCRPELRPAAPDRLRWTLFLQRADWPEVDPSPLRGAGMDLLPTGWPTERALTIAMAGDEARPRLQVLPALDRAREVLGDALDGARISHGSFEPLPEYPAGGPDSPAADNVVAASAALAPGEVRTPAERFALGLAAADAVAGAAASRPDEGILRRDLPALTPSAEVASDVVVVGAGTGGALAAIAAGQGFDGEAGHVLCFDPLPAAGGIGTIGGIHVYYYGLPGGLQQAADDRLAAVMDGHGGLFELPHGFHPLAKAIVLEEMIATAGVDLRFGWMLFDAGRDGGRVTSAWVATPDGPVRVAGRAWIDGTGDGDLCVRAGADWHMGRAGDGLTHAYSQSAGRLTDDDGVPRMRIVNYDAGFCDPTDAEDLTRARLAGIAQYDADTLENMSRPTCIAPALGLRQSRQVAADVELTLDDLIRRRRFDDAVGYTGCHYDNHAVDFHLESEEGAFWSWVARSFREPIACDMSYRMLLPRGLDNVWIASRCLGASQDAHYILRMQRDMQRIGEVAGRAAAMAARGGGAVDARGLDVAALRSRLERAGAMALPAPAATERFGRFLGAEMFEDRLRGDRGGEAMEALDAGRPGPLIWHLSTGADDARRFLRERLDSPDERVSWLAAGIAAMASDPAAEPRLLRAVRQREWGFTDADESDPFGNRKLAPSWLAALVLLRRCGTERCVPVLEEMSRAGGLSLSARVAIAMLLERLTGRGAADAAAVEAITDRLAAGDVPGRVAPPQRPIGAISHHAAQAAREGAPPADTADLAAEPTAQDYTWQLDLAVAKARRAAGLDLPDRLRAHLEDPRGHVRRAFAGLYGPTGRQPGQTTPRPPRGRN